MTTAAKTKPYTSMPARVTAHPWNEHLNACRDIAVPLAVFDITHALKYLRERSKAASSPKLFDVASLSAKICDGIIAVDATPHVEGLFGTESLEEFRSIMNRVLLGATLPQWNKLTDALLKSRSGLATLELTSTAPDVALHIQVVSTKVLNNQIFVLTMIQEAAQIIDQTARLTRFESLLEHSDDFVIALGPNGQVEYANRNANQVLAESQHSKNLAVQNVFSAASVVALLGACEALTSGVPSWTGTLDVLTHSDGHKSSPFHCNVGPIYGESGAINGFSVIGRRVDREENLRKELEMKDRIIDATLQLAVLGQVSSQVIHEINNPLTVITGKAEKILNLAQTNILDPNAYFECAEKIIKMTQRTDKLLRSMKGLSRKDYGTNLSKIAIRNVIDDIRGLIEIGGKKAGAVIKLPEISSDLFVLAQGSKLSLTLLNLFTNAFDAVSSQKDGWVELKVHSDANWITLRVVDSGTRIPAEISRKLFEAFFTTKGSRQGAGISLNLSRQIAQTFGGDLYYEDSAAHTTFVLKLPHLASSEPGQGDDWEEI